MTKSTKHDEWEKADCENCGEKQRRTFTDKLPDPDVEGVEISEGYCENCAQYTQFDTKADTVKPTKLPLKAKTKMKTKKIGNQNESNTI